MKIVLAASLLLPAIIFAQQAPASAKGPVYVPSPTGPEIPYEFSDPLKLPPDLYLGEVVGVATNSKNHLFVFHRGGKGTQLFEFDQTGKYLREIGKDLYGFEFAHVVRIDKDDNIWTVDEGTNMVVKFNPEGRVLMTIGRRPEGVEAPPPTAPGVIPPARDNAFNRPTDVTWDPAGNIYIADGYNNSRVAKLDKNGRWLKSWGTRGSAPGQFNTLHSIASDAQGNIYVADRANYRIQVFDGEGTLLRVIDGIGMPWAICITPGPNQMLFSADMSANAFQVGRIVKMDLNGKIEGVFGKGGRQPGEFGWVHEIDCRMANTLYVGEIFNWRVQKLTLKTGK